MWKIMYLFESEGFRKTEVQRVEKRIEKARNSHEIRADRGAEEFIENTLRRAWIGYGRISFLILKYSDLISNTWLDKTDIC